ncbi:MAG: SGNH/GDSL hydrolase family protein [Micropruina sp.]|nr:SGNH/GDSL hydrolase family protein [Micropruina sp.]
MLPQRRAAQYVGLILLALLATGLSITALLQSRPVAPARAVPAPAGTLTSLPTPSLSAASTPPEAPTESPSATSSTKLTSVVIVGDATSLGTGSDSWVERTTRALNWQVTNLSAPGMGFAKVASRCPQRCTTFRGIVPAIADVKPDIVVIFGSMADGDNPIGPDSREFFTALRKALPKTKIVALSPVMTKQGQLGWIRLHRNNIKGAVAAVDGRFIDLELPAFRAGGLSAKGQEQVAKRVVSALG